MKRTFTEKVELEICRRYAGGEDTTQLGRLYGVSPSTVWRALKRNNASTRPRPKVKPKTKGMHGPLCGKEEQVCSRYLAGETQAQIGESLGVSRQSVSLILVRNGINGWNDVRGRWPEICSRYMAGESVTRLADAYAIHSSSIFRIIVRNGIKPRGGKGWCDTIQNALDCTGHHSESRDCSFYLFELANYASTHCKPGIAFDIGTRTKGGKGQYGVEALRLMYGTRQEAYFLEQAVLDATRGAAQCPAGLTDWLGASEVRAMPAEDMLPIVERLAGEMEELGVWAFAAAYVPMTAAQRATCQQRALANAPVLSSASTAE